jgi:hypothetical protein
MKSHLSQLARFFQRESHRAPWSDHSSYAHTYKHPCRTNEFDTILLCCVLPRLVLSCSWSWSRLVCSRLVLSCNAKSWLGSSCLGWACVLSSRAFCLAWYSIVLPCGLRFVLLCYVDLSCLVLSSFSFHLAFILYHFQHSIHHGNDVTSRHVLYRVRFPVDGALIRFHHFLDCFPNVTKTNVYTNLLNNNARKEKTGYYVRIMTRKDGSYRADSLFSRHTRSLCQLIELRIKVDCKSSIDDPVLGAKKGGVSQICGCKRRFLSKTL